MYGIKWWELTPEEQARKLGWAFARLSPEAPGLSTTPLTVTELAVAVSKMMPKKKSKPKAAGAGAFDYFEGPGE